MGKVRIETLDTGDLPLLEASIALLADAFEGAERYSAARLGEELPGGTALFYRQYFVAAKGCETVGFGGVKAAEWASHTHPLYLLAVARQHRGQGIGRALQQARADWAEKNFKPGRILVSSARAGRFHAPGFVPIPKSGIEGRYLMMRRF
ncbi:MAG: GNAT family N-acetyltransferase [Betaproteobacteria bacterium]|nr:GNAT family N-acetyltransferase [Betaproteobacteria bacterium]